MTTTLKDGRGYALLRAQDGEAAPTLYLYDILGVDLFGGIAAREIVDDLAALADAPELAVRINSPGGDVFEGIAVYNALTRFPGNVTVHIDGIAASIASLVAMAGDKTLIAENAMVMIHRPWTVAMGDAPEMRRQADVLDRTWSSMQATYARRTGRRATTFEQHVAAAGGEWWLTAEEAVAEGLADSVEKPTKQAQVFGLSRFKKVPARLAATAQDAAPVLAPAAPHVDEIAPPRVVATPDPEPSAPATPEPAALAPMPGGTTREQRRRVLDVLRLTS